MGRDRAAYMREYRKRNKKGLIAELEFRSGLADDIRESMEETIRQQSGRIAELDARNVGLEEEVRHLKTELAKRPQAGRHNPCPTCSGTGDLTNRQLDDLVTSEVRAHRAERVFNSRPFTPVPKRK